METEGDRCRNERKKRALERLATKDVKCQTTGCNSVATTVYCTSCHGDWFMCDKCSDAWQDCLKKIDQEREKRDGTR